MPMHIVNELRGRDIHQVVLLTVRFRALLRGISHALEAAADPLRGAYFRDCLVNDSFNGVTGPFAIDKGGTRIGAGFRVINGPSPV